MSTVKSHCKRGHPFDSENTYVRPSNGIRECRTCKKAAERKRNKGRDPRSDEVRFFRKVQADGECWRFGSTAPDGYGRFWFEGRTRPAHRWLYEFMVCELPAHLHLDHLCRNRWCVNPAHLEPVTPRINTLRGDTVAAANILKSRCVRGHPLSADNLRVYRGHRRCRECHRINAAASRARLAAK